MPNLAAGKELALATAKTLKYEYLETRPEIVCGYPPKIDKTMTVGDAGASAP